MLRKKMRKPVVQAVAVIFLCFLLTSTGWLVWNSRVHGYLTVEKTNIVTMAAGYFLQALGIGGFAAVLRLKPEMAAYAFFAAALLHMAFMIPSVICIGAAGIASGLIMEFFCGIIAGYYLYYYVRKVSKKYLAQVFGIGYGLSVLASWLLTLTGELYYSEKVLFMCAALTAGILFFVHRYPLGNRENQWAEEKPVDRSLGYGSEKSPRSDSKNLLLRGILVLLIGLVINCGYSFSPVQLGDVVNVEMSRLVYVISLITAGIVTDRDRKKGAVFALTALLFPFIMLSLRDETIPAAVFWMLSYFAFGFYSVYRIILFADLDIVYLSGFGLMIGRIGDAAGEIISLLLGNRPVIHVGLVAGLSVAVIFVFFRIYYDLYLSGGAEYRQMLPVSEAAGRAPDVDLPGTAEALQVVDFLTADETLPALDSSETRGKQQSVVFPETAGRKHAGDYPAASGRAQEVDLSETVGSQQDVNFPETDGIAETADIAEAESQPGDAERFYLYAARYELSPRERDVMRQVLEDKTNCEIAEILYISENTVKFHVRNILKKTGCKNRNELIMDYTVNSTV